MTDKLKELFDEVCVVNRPSILVYGFPYIDPSRASEYYGSHREYISKYISGYDKYVKHYVDKFIKECFGEDAKYMSMKVSYRRLITHYGDGHKRNIIQFPYIELKRLTILFNIPTIDEFKYNNTGISSSYSNNIKFGFNDLNSNPGDVGVGKSLSSYNINVRDVEKMNMLINDDHYSKSRRRRLGEWIKEYFKLVAEKFDIVKNRMVPKGSIVSKLDESSNICRLYTVGDFGFTTHEDGNITYYASLYPLGDVHEDIPHHEVFDCCHGMEVISLDEFNRLAPEYSGREFIYEIIQQPIKIIENKNEEEII